MTHEQPSHAGLHARRNWKLLPFYQRLETLVGVVPATVAALGVLAISPGVAYWLMRNGGPDEAVAS